LQAKVFRLVREDGTPTGKVIKVNHDDLGSKMLNNDVVWIGMHREWRTGTQVSPAVAAPAAAWELRRHAAASNGPPKALVEAGWRRLSQGGVCAHCWGPSLAPSPLPSGLQPAAEPSPPPPALT
jgi:hypothetical protein